MSEMVELVILSRNDFKKDHERINRVDATYNIHAGTHNNPLKIISVFTKE